MPDQILNSKLYADRTFQNWHRDALPNHWKAIDLDLMGYCALCREAVYLVEATTNPNKYTTVLHALAARARIPALLIFHNGDGGLPTGGRLLWPERRELPELTHVRAMLNKCRERHHTDVHGTEWRDDLHRGQRVAS